MTQQEHLQKIKAKCEQLLAEKTPWHVYCQAGWQATIIAIDGLASAEALIYSVQNDYDDSPTKWWVERRTEVTKAQEAIIAAWPEELL